MSELMVEVGGASMQDHQQQRHRRPRVREVSSRYMPPVVSSSASGDLHLFAAAKSPLPKQQQRSTSAQRRRHLELEALDVNTIRSSETPFQSGLQSSKKPHRSSVKLFKENNNNNNGVESTKFSGRNPSSSRPDTPTVGRLRHSAQNFHRSGNAPTATAAAKLLQSTLSCSSSQEASLNSSSSNDNNNDDNTLQSCDLRSSMPEADSFKFFASPACSRSLNMSLPSSEHSLFRHSIKGGNEKPTTSSGLSRSYSNSMKTGGLCLPPVPPCAKLGSDARKGRKVSSHQEDVHSLKLLHNNYLKWRFANAKSEASMKAQKREAEKSIYSLGVRISDLFDSVKMKSMELGLLRRTNTLSRIIEAQMPYLDKWSELEGDYSVSLSEAIQALLNTSLHLPITGNVRADIIEVGEALNSATRAMEMIVSSVQCFMPKAQEMEILVSELARVTGGERALVEECGDLLSRTHSKQVKECSLRGQLIQLRRRCPPSHHPCEE